MNLAILLPCQGPALIQAFVIKMVDVQRQALETIKTSVEQSIHPVFPCALIAGDVVILDLLSKLDYLKTGKVAVAFIDTFHLFPETITFMTSLEVPLCIAFFGRVRMSHSLSHGECASQEKYGFKAHEFHAGLSDLCILFSSFPYSSCALSQDCVEHLTNRIQQLQ